MPFSISPNYTAVIQKHGQWWIGWVEEVPGVNSQGATREELLDNLRSALEKARDESSRCSGSGSQGRGV